MKTTGFPKGESVGPSTIPEVLNDTYLELGRMNRPWWDEPLRWLASMDDMVIGVFGDSCGTKDGE